MRLELLINVQVLAPEQIPFVLSCCHFESLYELGRADKLISQKHLNVEHEWLVLDDAMLYVSVQLGNFVFDAPEHGQIVLDFLFYRIADPLLGLELPGSVLLLESVDWRSLHGAGAEAGVRRYH